MLCSFDVSILLDRCFLTGLTPFVLCPPPPLPPIAEAKCYPGHVARSAKLTLVKMGRKMIHWLNKGVAKMKDTLIALIKPMMQIIMPIIRLLLYPLQAKLQTRIIAECSQIIWPLTAKLGVDETAVGYPTREWSWRILGAAAVIPWSPPPFAA